MSENNAPETQQNESGSLFKRINEWVENHYGEIWLPLLGALLVGLIGIVIYAWGIVATMELWFIKRYHNKYPAFRYALNLVSVAISTYIIISYFAGKSY